MFAGWLPIRLQTAYLAHLHFVRELPLKAGSCAYPYLIQASSGSCSSCKDHKYHTELQEVVGICWRYQSHERNLFPLRLLDLSSDGNRRCCFCPSVRIK